MDGMKWIAAVMQTAQARLEMATANLASAHVSGYVEQHFAAQLTEHGITISSESGSRDAPVPPNSAPGSVPETDAPREMIAVLEAQRGFETAQKVALAFDAVRAKDAAEIGRAAT